ncbi:hypothetical protein ACFLZI_01915, partial [Nitrospirota bacterium]
MECEDLSKEKRSLQRSKKSIVTLAQIMGPRAMDLLVPGTGMAFDALKACLEHVGQFYKDRSEDRIENLHKMLFEDCTNEEAMELLGKDLSAEDYHSILSALIQDEEDAKTKIYASILKAIIEGRVDKKYRAHMIRSAKEMNIATFELMRRIFIASQVLFEGQKSIELQISGMFKSSDPLDNFAAQNLLRYGYIDENYSKNQELLDTLVSVVFEQSELTPTSIGKKAWGNNDEYVLIATDINDEQVDKIKAELKKLNIRLSTVTPNEVPQLFKKKASAGISLHTVGNLKCLVCVTSEGKN